MNKTTGLSLRQFRLIFGLFLGVGSGVGLAAEEIPDKSGFSGFLLFGLGHLDLESNTAAGNDAMEVGSPVIGSIFTSPDSSDDVHPVLTGEVRYTLAGGQTQAFVGNSIGDLLQLDITQRLGIRSKMDHAGTLGLAYVFSGITPEVWEDPFLTGSTRTATERDAQGVRFEWDGVFGSGFDLDLSYGEIDIDVERSGESLGLNAANRAFLDRNGNQYSIVLDYTWSLAPEHILQPQFGYRDDDRDGGAVASDSYWIQLTHIYQRDHLTVATNALLRQADYDSTHPVYGIQQGSDQFLVGTVVSYRLNPRWSATGLLTYSESDSNIDFYDTEVVSAILGLGYRF